MPPLRLATGKAVSPLGRLKLASARDVSLRPAGVLKDQDPKALPLASAGSITEHELSPGGGVEEHLTIYSLSQPRLIPLAGKVEAAGIEMLPVHTWETGENRILDATSALQDAQLARLWPSLSLPYFVDTEEEAREAFSLLPYQRDAVRALISDEALFLADDPGSGKTPSVCVAAGHLVQSGEVDRVLLVAPASRHRWWERHFEQWAPGLFVGRAGGPRAKVASIWAKPFHVLICDYSRAADDIPRLKADRKMPRFDLIVADSILTAIHQVPQGAQSIGSLEGRRRWAVAGGTPAQTEDWRTLFAFLMPGQPLGRGETSLEIQERLASNILRRKKLVLEGIIPTRVRRELWLDLDPRQVDAYRAALAEERHMLEQLGEATTRTHIESVVATLNRMTAFAQGSLDGTKVRALTDLMEQILAAGDRAVLFSQYRQRALDPLRQAMHAYGGIVLPENSGESERSQILETFRRDPQRRILLAHLDAASDGKPLPASYIIHFDISWNSARRLRAEQRFFPSLKPEVPLTILEFWVAGTHDEWLHELLAGKGLLASDLPMGTRPSELEDRLTIADWLKDVFGGKVEGAPDLVTRPGTTGLLPGTAMLRSALNELTEDELEAAVKALMDALGFPDALPVTVEDLAGIALEATSVDGAGRVLVNVLRQDETVGVAAARSLLRAAGDLEHVIGAYLVTTGDFTRACKQLAEESEGRLALVSGDEFYRHLHILGWF